jgi:CheY-like chemotaxis protein
MDTVMSIQMPEPGAVAATRQIRALGKRIRQPHIIALTAHALVDDRECYLAVAIEACVSKPVRMAVHNQALMAAAFQVDIAMEPEQGTNVRRSVIDWTVLENLLISLEDEGSATVAEMIQLFEQETGQQIAMLATALQAENREQLRLLAHRVRGGASQLGAMRVVEACWLLEVRSAVAAPAELEDVRRRLQVDYQEALRVLQARWPN